MHKDCPAAQVLFDPFQFPFADFSDFVPFCIWGFSPVQFGMSCVQAELSKRRAELDRRERQLEAIQRAQPGATGGNRVQLDSF